MDGTFEMGTVEWADEAPPRTRTPRGGAFSELIEAVLKNPERWAVIKFDTLPSARSAATAIRQYKIAKEHGVTTVLRGSTVYVGIDKPKDEAGGTDA